MMKLTIYYKNGNRSYYDHVAQITNITGEYLILDFITDFGDQMSRILKSNEVEKLGVKMV